ncbi:MAG: hypothetical protein WBM83_04085 [Flavobacteriaceae bacterium]
MLKTLLSALFVSVFFCANAQTNKYVEKGLFKANALISGVSYELGVGNISSFNFDVVVFPGSAKRIDDSYVYGLFGGVQAEYRYFTNFGRRISKSKNINGNSGNYVGVVNQFYIGKPIVGDYVMSSSFYNIVGFTYGIQRTRPKGFYWNLSFGPAVVIDEYDPGATLFVDIKLGWVLRKSK